MRGGATVTHLVPVLGLSPGAQQNIDTVSWFLWVPPLLSGVCLLSPQPQPKSTKYVTSPEFRVFAKVDSNLAELHCP